MVLQSYNECVGNRSLFKMWDGGVGCGDGCFVFDYVGGFEFYWFSDGVWHRVDGPAFIGVDRCVWYFLGEHVIGVKSQVEFEEWLVGKL